MGKRLSKIYTRTGDGGETGLGDGSRVSKTHPRVEAMGSVDELNSIVGVVVEALILEGNDDLVEIAEFMRSLQHRIFDLGGELSIPGFEIVTADHVSAIEQHLDALNEHLDPLENFILPGGSIGSAHLQLARTVCRRAEREATTLVRQESIGVHVLQYLNRLSDLAFVLSRWVNQSQGVEETTWIPNRAETTS